MPLAFVICFNYFRGGYELLGDFDIQMFDFAG